jgi:hypothetical protein
MYREKQTLNTSIVVWMFLQVSSVIMLRAIFVKC